MSLRDKIREGLYKLRVIPKPGMDSSLATTKDSDTVINQVQKALDNGEPVDFTDFTRIDGLKMSREERCAAYEEMVLDGRIGAAIEMYANDAVQYNPEGKVIWVESDDEENKTVIVAYVEKLLKDLHIPENIWSYAYCLCLYGDVYLETFANTSNSGDKPTLLVEPARNNLSVLLQKKLDGSKIERYVEKIPNPVEIYDLQYRGKTSGFVRSLDDLKESTNKNNNNGLFTTYYNNTNHNVSIYSPQKFVHICLSPNINRFPAKFNLFHNNKLNKIDNNSNVLDGTNLEGAGGDLCYDVKMGQSILENVYYPYQSLKLKEDSVTLERITKASITRIIQVELGDMPEPQKKVKLQEIKQQIEQQLIMNKDQGYLQSTPGAQPMENIIYTTTKNGKGTISTVNIGGDVNIGDLADIDKAENKLYGALLIPKALLGGDMEGSGLSNGGSLTEMNTTYARRIKRIQSALIAGITDLVNIFALAEGVGTEIIGKFNIKLTPVITVEDVRRDELLSTKINNVRDIMGLFSGLDEKIDESTKISMLSTWLSNYLSQQDIVSIIDKTLKEQEDEQQNNIEDTQVDEEESIEDIDFDSETPSFPNLNSPQDDMETYEAPDLDTAEDINTSDIEGEDLV